MGSKYINIHNQTFEEKAKKTEIHFKKTKPKINYLSSILLYRILIMFTILQKISGKSILVTKLETCENLNMISLFYSLEDDPNGDTNKKIMKFNEDIELIDLRGFFKNNYCIKEIDFSDFLYEGITDASGMFENCIHLEKVDFNNFFASNIIDMSRMFYNCSSLTTINFDQEKFITSSLLNMEYMFSNCKKLESLDLKIFDTSKVLYMNNLFEDCIGLKSLDVSSFDTRNVIQMESMFQNCQSLENLELENFYTSSARQIYNIFYGCSSLKSINIINFDTFQITNFANLFYDCSSLTSLNLESFDTDLGSDMSYMFYNCQQLTLLNLTNFDTERVIKMNSMFEKCSSLEEIILGKFSNTRTVDVSRLFYGCKNLVSINIQEFFTPEVQNMNSMFYDCIKLTELNLSHFDTSNVINMNSMFFGCESLSSINFQSFNTFLVKDMASMLEKCTSLTSLEISSFKADNLEKIDAMFRNCINLKYLTFSSFNTSNVYSMKSMFYGCINLESIDLTLFNTNKVNYMDEMFYKCSSLIFLDLSKFYLKEVKNMGYMFYGCKSLTSMKLPEFEDVTLKVSNTSHMFMGCSSISDLDLSYFDLTNVYNFDYMFAECSFLKNLNLDGWKTNSARSMDYMFAGCSSLNRININNFNTPNLESIKGMFYGCVSLADMDLSYLKTSNVKTTAYMFYKAYSITSIRFYRAGSPPTTYFQTPLVTDMSFMFAYCTNLQKVDLSLFETDKVVDMSNMFIECKYLTSVNLSSFDTSHVTSMENMFYNCLNLGYLNLKISNDGGISNMDNVITNTPDNTLFCIDTNLARKLHTEIIKKVCYNINCTDITLESRKRINFTDNTCIKNCSEKLLFEFDYHCYDECPNNTVAEELMCYLNYSNFDKCTIERVLLGLCEINKLDDYKDTVEFTNEIREKFIDQILENFKKSNFKVIIPRVLNGEIITILILNETYQISMLSNKNKIKGTTYIDIQDCENILRQNNQFGEQEELILLKIEYIVVGFKIPIIEYVIFSEKGGGEIDLDVCKKMNFYYYIPVVIDSEEEYLYDPYNEYNSELCYQYTSDNNTDIILFDRQKFFNENNMSLCESNCKYIEYAEGTVKCECEIKTDFNKFFTYTEEEIENLIYKFKNIKINKYNFGIIKCFQMLFTSAGFFDNYASILYLVLIGLNAALTVFFCLKGFQTIYSDIKSISTKDPKKPKPNLNSNIGLKKGLSSKNIISSSNPPKKGPNDAVISIKSLKMNKAQSNLIKSDKSKIMNSSFDSKNAIKKNDNKLFPNKSNGKKNNDLDDITDIDVDIETNLLPYNEALKKDKRSFIRFYLSLLKSRNLLFSIFNNDYNSLIMKIDFIIYILGFCIGINTIFFTDESVQKIYFKFGSYTIMENITSHLIDIILSALIVSVIKSITACFIYSDRIFLKSKELNDVDEEEQFNNNLIKIMSKNMVIFILNYIFQFIFWVYVGSFCAVYKNSQTFLIINGIICFFAVLILNFLYYFFPALLRMISLNGKNSQCLYKASQYIQMI